jgi:hypothetical protein
MLSRQQSPIRRHAFSFLPQAQGKGILSSHSRLVPWNRRTRHRMPVGVADDEAMVRLLDGPRRREAAALRCGAGVVVSLRGVAKGGTMLSEFEKEGGFWPQSHRLCHH